MTANHGVVKHIIPKQAPQMTTRPTGAFRTMQFDSQIIRVQNLISRIHHNVSQRPSVSQPPYSRTAPQQTIFRPLAFHPAPYEEQADQYRSLTRQLDTEIADMDAAFQDRQLRYADLLREETNASKIRLQELTREQVLFEVRQAKLEGRLTHRVRKVRKVRERQARMEARQQDQRRLEDPEAAISGVLELLLGGAVALAREAYARGR
eukprot:gnl/Dysnectes_brevis/6836_a10901_145.p1 GENE.gnl/Dysnectes_brevis/6836_a10901_145~~gnl/Dysnectes_brevis/6836_a10901_145.p1  ORF type:complete len:207 (-),score=50.60 gnl/Dysnectes_brevis/6836_a10901_145:327-947(-)